MKCALAVLLHAAPLDALRASIPVRRCSLHCTLSDDAHAEVKRAKHPDLKGTPLSPWLADDVVLVRYIYDGGKLAQGRLCRLTPALTDMVTTREVEDTLRSDGVDLEQFFPRECTRPRLQPAVGCR